jgi:hypothetical protein
LHGSCCGPWALQSGYKSGEQVTERRGIASQVPRDTPKCAAFLKGYG